MRFQCLAAEADGNVICAAVATCSIGKAKSAVRTFAGSGVGRRAILVCGVIAGRIRTASAAISDATVGYESPDMADGELVVLDSRT
ncbi:hypothetical protein ACP70R_030115 [Stipagrostis hirtigluma subsp. patula]